MQVVHRITPRPFLGALAQYRKGSGPARLGSDRHWLSEDAAWSDGSSATSSLTFVMLQPPPRLANEMMIVHFNIRVRRVYVSERVRTFRRLEGARRKEIISYLTQTGTRGVFPVEVSADRHLDPTARPPAVPVKGRPPPPHTSIIARRCDETLAPTSMSVIDGEAVLPP